MKEKFSIGIDYGSLSGRAVLVNLSTGEEVATAVKPYTHQVMDEYIPGSDKKLPPDWALQHPQDYIEVLQDTIPTIIKEAGILPEQVIGIGIDFTACTMLPIYEDGTPLCMTEKYALNPHAYVKLWKHHAAQPEANKLNEIAMERNEDFLNYYGGKISSEWLVPKILQILNEDEDLYNECDLFVEAADWVIMQMTGKLARNSCTAGYKGLWNKQKGYPSNDFYKALDERLENLLDTKLKGDIYPNGSKAGELTASMAEKIGLCEGVAIAVANVDAHVAIPAVGIAEAGKMLMIMGTSTCDILLGEQEKIVPGMCGVVEDGVLPGFQGFEAGQSCVGDHFAWLVDNCVPARYFDEAKENNMNIHEYLTYKANQLKPGESGLLALDWWNGNRSVLVDVDLTGMILGMTLLTKPYEIYRALIEATAYGTRKIIETFEENGVPINELYAAGGIAEKNSMMMQIYADVTNREIKISGSSQAPALGSAIFGAVVAGSEKGGFDDINQAIEKLSKLKDIVYTPDVNNVKIYNELYQEYNKLHDYFGRGENDVMKNLKKIKLSVKDEI